MRLIDADAFDKYLLGAEIEATKNRKYVFSSAINTIRGNLANFPTVNQWIPCTERLPNVGAILISDGNQVFIGAYYGNSIWSADGCDYDPILEDIAWMPLPDPYKERKEQ